MVQFISTEETCKQAIWKLVIEAQEDKRNAQFF